MGSLGATPGYLENLQLGMWETLLDPPRHLETFCCSNGWYTTGNSETLPLDHLPTVTTIYMLLLSHHAGNGESVVFSRLCRFCSGVGYNFLRSSNPSGGFIVIWMVWARTLPGTYCHLNSLLFPFEPAPHLPQGIFSGLEKLCLCHQKFLQILCLLSMEQIGKKWSIH